MSGTWIALCAAAFVAGAFTGGAVVAGGDRAESDPVLRGTRGADALVALPALAEIPPGHRRIYIRAGRRYGIDWPLIAAVGRLESDHGRGRRPGVRRGRDGAGAAGPMQFQPETWAAHGVDGNDDGRIDVYDPVDAIAAAAAFLRATGAADDPRRALYAYNPDSGYVEDALALAARYRGSLGQGRARRARAGAQAPAPR